MKKYLFALVFVFTAIIAFAQDDGSRTIDAQDTVVFDLSQASEASGYVEFPVYFLSDDTVNALDFSLKYNTTGLAFDSIIKLASYLQITSNLAADTTLYFTSYSLQRITNDTPLVMIRFTVLTPGQLCSEDLTSVVAYLNGDACTEKIIDCIPNGIADTDNDNDVTVIYPNPSKENAVLEFSLAAKSTLNISVHDITGKIIYKTLPSECSSGSHKVNLNLSGLENGVYIICIHSENETKSTRISVIR